MSPSRLARSFTVFAFVVVVVALGLGCGSFGTANTTDDGGIAPDASVQAPYQGVPCGSVHCAAPLVCCFDAASNTESCSAREHCTGAPIACKTSLECLAAGAPTGSVCCANNDTTKLLSTECVSYASCNAALPQDWLCDPSRLPSVECAEPARANCRAYPLPAPLGLAFCSP